VCSKPLQRREHFSGVVGPNCWVLIPLSVTEHIINDSFPGAFISGVARAEPGIPIVSQVHQPRLITIDKSAKRGIVSVINPDLSVNLRPRLQEAFMKLLQRARLGRSITYGEPAVVALRHVTDQGANDKDKLPGPPARPSCCAKPGWRPRSETMKRAARCR